jgi:hypothetical protein
MLAPAVPPWCSELFTSSLERAFITMVGSMAIASALAICVMV